MRTLQILLAACFIISVFGGCPSQTVPSVIGLWDGVSYLDGAGKAVSVYEATFHANGTATIYFPGTDATRTMSYSQNGSTIRILGSQPIVDDLGTGATHAAQDTVLLMEGNDYMYGDTYVTFFFEDGSEAVTGYWTEELYRR